MIDSLPELIRVEFNLDTYMWNEGFERAADPWLTIYTDNGSWARSLSSSYMVVGSVDGLPQSFSLRVDWLDPRLKAPTQDELNALDEDAEEEARPSVRFVALTPGLSSVELDSIVDTRLAQWDGV